MSQILLCFVLSLFMMSCQSSSVQNDESMDESHISKEGTISSKLLEEYQWSNEPDSILLEASSLRVVPAENTDFFNNPEDNSVVGNAPFLHREVTGDFILTAHVEPDFKDTWNAVTLMVFADSQHWIKFAFEDSDATGIGIVSVVTDLVSDDANGVPLSDEKAVWLKLARKGNIYSMHWSRDNEVYHMARLTRLETPETVQAGVVFQSPVGREAHHKLHTLHIEHKTIDDLRNLNAQQ